MSKAVLISIRPQWCEKIANGEKTIEVRKTRPKLETPFKGYIYCTNGQTIRTAPKAYCKNVDGSIVYKQEIMNGKVIGEFVCDGIYPIRYTMDGFADVVDCNRSLLKPSDFITYGKGKPLYGWHISNLKLYDEPKKLSEFTELRKTRFGMEPVAITRPPQSWGYVEELP